jgi:hypothetical protein
MIDPQGLRIALMIRIDVCPPNTVMLIASLEMGHE